MYVIVAECHQTQSAVNRLTNEQLRPIEYSSYNCYIVYNGLYVCVQRIVE